MADFNQDRVDQLLQYILAVAGQETGWDRELGMIHLIKYAYLADLSYAKHHNGQTYTGLKWIFHHFGPWTVECYKRIDPALEAVRATKKKIESDKHGDFYRWYADDYLFDKLNERMDLTVAGSVQKYFRKFGNDTYGLLDFVYKTEPMINAAPEEILEFLPSATADDTPREVEKKAEPTPRQLKKRRKELAAFKVLLNKKLDKKIQDRKSKVCPMPPRYDDVFFEGLEQLDKSAEVHLEEGRYLAAFNNNVWKSKLRHDPELS